MSEKILIVDDEQLVREIMARRIEGNGFKCLTAENGNKALELLSENEVSLVLLDISMPGMSGIEVLKEINVNYPFVMVIMITAVVDIKAAINAMKLGAFDYLIKPIDNEILSLSIARALERRMLLLENREYQHNLELKVDEQTGEIKKSYINTIKSLAYALEAKDKYTHGHSERVTDIAVKIAMEFNFSDEAIEKIRLAGLLHDIGKIGISEDILNKPGRLDKEEFEQVKTHSEVGEHILSPVIKDKDILDMVIHHHERYDGTGYPDGLVNGQISLNAAILAVADAYDAMTSDRPYRKALSIEKAREELEKYKGKQFDPKVVEALFRILEKGVIL